MLPFPIDHVGIAVKSIDVAAKPYEALGGSVTHREKVYDQSVEVAFIDTPSGSIELLAALDEKSPVAKFLSRHGEGLHHVAFRVASIAEILSSLEAKGVELIDKSPRKGARGKLIAFLHPKSFGGVLIELCQKEA